MFLILDADSWCRSLHDLSVRRLSALRNTKLTETSALATRSAPTSLENTQTYWIIILNLTRFPSDSHVHYRLRIPGLVKSVSHYFTELGVPAGFPGSISVIFLAFYSCSQEGCHSLGCSAFTWPHLKTGRAVFLCVSLLNREDNLSQKALTNLFWPYWLLPVDFIHRANGLVKIGQN